MSSRPPLTVASVALGALAALAACGTPTLDDAKLTGAITDKIHQEAPNASVSVSCPPGIPIQAGATVQCTATVDGQVAHLTVTQDDDQGNVSYASQEAFLDLSKAREQITDQLTAKIPGTWTVACAPPGAAKGLYLAAPNSTFTCEVTGKAATGEGQAGTIKVTVEDTEGTISWELQRG